MNKREEQIRKEFWVDKKPHQIAKKEITKKDTTKSAQEFNGRIDDVANSRPKIITGDPAKIFGVGGAMAGKPCNKSIKSTQALGKETIEELKDKDNMSKVRSDMENQKENFKEQEDERE